MKPKNHMFVLCDARGPFLGIVAMRDKRRKSGFKPFLSKTIRPPTGEFGWMAPQPCECGCGEASWSLAAELAVAKWLEVEMERCKR